MARHHNGLNQLLSILVLILPVGCSTSSKKPDVPTPTSQKELCNLLAGYENHVGLTSGTPSGAITDFAYVAVNCTKKQMIYEMQIAAHDDSIPEGITDELTEKTLELRCPSISIQKFGWTIIDQYFNTNGRLMVEITASPSTCDAAHDG